MSYFRSISEDLFDKERLSFIDEDGEMNIITKISAITSKVISQNGKVMHIPMLDFDFSFSNTDANFLEQIKKANLPPGLILETNQSYHYYGFELLSHEEWNRWLDKLLLLENKEELFGVSFLEYSKERSYTALRIFAFSGTNKDKVPRLVARI